MECGTLEVMINRELILNCPWDIEFMEDFDRRGEAGSWEFWRIIRDYNP